MTTMGIIRIYRRSKKAPKKPGWKQQEQEYRAWLKSVQALKTNFSSRNREPVRTTVERSVPPASIQQPEPIKKGFEAFCGPTTKPVHRPELMYRDSPELLKRELEARERRFLTAPMYNKGAPQLVTEETLKDIMSGSTRRRN